MAALVIVGTAALFNATTPAYIDIGAADAAANGQSGHGSSRARSAGGRSDHLGTPVVTREVTPDAGPELLPIALASAGLLVAIGAVGFTALTRSRIRRVPQRTRNR